MKIIILSLVYRFVRFLVTKVLYLIQKFFFMKKDLEPAVKFGDNSLARLNILSGSLYEFEIPSNNGIEIYGMKFPSPLIGSSFKSDPNILDIWMKMGLGGLIFKTIMRNKRIGNPYPRLQDAYFNKKSGLFNSLGLPGMGVTDFLEYLKNTELWKYERPLGISIGGDDENEYLSNLLELDPFLKTNNKPYFYELNISCPNTKNGKSLCQDPSTLEILLKNIRKIINAPISVKISPDISDALIRDIADLCNNHEKIIINAGNTQYKEPHQVGIKQSDFSMRGGGLSGLPLFERTLEMVKILSEFNIPIIATGGISTIKHLSILKNSGASLFGMASSLVIDPYCIPKIHSEIHKL